MKKGKRMAALISVIVLACALIFIAFELFQVREIKVSGCITLDTQQIEEQSGIEYGQIIFFVDTDAAMAALATNPNVKPVSVKVVYPYSIEIEIAERTPVAYIDLDGVRLAIDSEGVLLSVDMSPQGEALPQVFGFSTARFEVGQPLGEDAYKRSVFSGLLAALADSSLDIVRIDISYAASIKLETQDGYTLELGDESELTTKFTLAQRMMDEVATLGKVGGTIDVATTDHAYYREN